VAPASRWRFLHIHRSAKPPARRRYQTMLPAQNTIVAEFKLHALLEIHAGSFSELASSRSLIRGTARFGG